MFNPLAAEWALRALLDFTLSNVRRFYSSMGNPLDGKGLTNVLNICFVLEFRVSFRTTQSYPSKGSMEIFNNGTWKDLCVANWDVAERNLVCQAQGYNGSSLGVHFKSAANSLGNTTYSCEQLTQNCEEEIKTEIKCSGIKTFLISIDTSINIVALNRSLKWSHSTHSALNEIFAPK